MHLLLVHLGDEGRLWRCTIALALGTHSLLTVALGELGVTGHSCMPLSPSFLLVVPHHDQVRVRCLHLTIYSIDIGTRWMPLKLLILLDVGPKAQVHLLKLRCLTGDLGIIRAVSGQPTAEASSSISLRVPDSEL